MTGFATASLDGLALVAESIKAGSFLTVGGKGAAPPSQSGQTTLALLAGVEAELASRGEAPGSR